MVRCLSIVGQWHAGYIEVLTSTRGQSVRVLLDLGMAGYRIYRLLWKMTETREKGPGSKNVVATVSTKARKDKNTSDWRAVLINYFPAEFSEDPNNVYESEASHFPNCHKIMSTISFLHIPDYITDGKKGRNTKD